MPQVGIQVRHAETHPEFPSKQIKITFLLMFLALAVSIPTWIKQTYRCLQKGMPKGRMFSVDYLHTQFTCSQEQ